MQRRARLIAILSLVIALLVPTPASAESASQLRARLDRIQARAARAGRAFSAAYWQLDETEVALIKTRNAQKSTARGLAEANARLGDRVNGIYRRDGFDVFGFLMGASTFEQFVTRADYVQRIGSSDAQAVAEVKRLRARLAAQERRLKAERATRGRDLRRLRARRDKLQAQLRSLQADYAQVKRRLDAVRAGGRLPSGVVSAAGGNGMVFPVAGPHYYADTWGASRSGGRRRHRGTDIMSPTGTPCVAVLSGTVRASYNSLGGLSIWLRSDSGWSFYYAHLSRYAVRSGHVRAGQVIGYVGSTGNAAGGAPHLHFQMHPNGGAPVNPYPYLRAME